MRKHESEIQNVSEPFGVRSADGTGCIGGSCGFTLLELVLAMFISALVMSILSVAFSFCLRMWERHQNRPRSDTFQLLQHLALQLGTMDTTAIRIGDETKPVFLANETSLAFATSQSLKSLSKGVPVIARYVFRGDEKKLYYGEMPLSPNQPDMIKQFLEMDPGDDNAWPRFYSTDIARLSFAFLEREQEGSLSRAGFSQSRSTDKKASRKAATKEGEMDIQLLGGVLVQADAGDGSSPIDRLMIPKFLDFGSQGSTTDVGTKTTAK